MNQLTNDYTIPNEACNTWRLVYQRLQAIEKQHIDMCILKIMYCLINYMHNNKQALIFAKGQLWNEFSACLTLIR